MDCCLLVARLHADGPWRRTSDRGRCDGATHIAFDVVANFDNESGTYWIVANRLFHQMVTEGHISPSVL